MPDATSPDQQRQLAIDLFNQAWTMMENPDRDADDDDRMLHAAHASRYLWGEVGEPVNRVRGEWQISRVYCVLGRAEPALHHAGRCLALCGEHGIGDFDLAYAHEALARARGLAGDRDGANDSRRLAEQAAAGIADADDREHLLRDLATLPS